MQRRPNRRKPPVLIHAKNGHAGSLRPAGFCRPGIGSSAEVQRRLFLLDWEIEAAQRDWEVAAASPKIVRVCGYPGRSRASVSRHVFNWALAGRCAARPREHITWAPKCADHGETLLGMGAGKAGTAGI